MFSYILIEVSKMLIFWQTDDSKLFFFSNNKKNNSEKNFRFFSRNIIEKINKSNLLKYMQSIWMCPMPLSFWVVVFVFANIWEHCASLGWKKGNFRTGCCREISFLRPNEGTSKTPRISQHHRIEGFKWTLKWGPHYAGRRQPFGQQIWEFCNRWQV